MGMARKRKLRAMWRILKSVNIQTVIIVFLLILLIGSWKPSSSPYSTKKEGQHCPELPSVPVKNDPELLILIWTWPFGETFPLDTCHSLHGISGCKLTTDRNLYSQANALIIHHFDIMEDKGLLPKEPRPHHQRWVWFNLEPPLIIKNLNMMGNHINMTMTYRTDSDIPLPYGWLKTLKEPPRVDIPKKSKLVAWVVSKWYPGIRRTQYYEELKKHIHIDVYGKMHKKLSWEEFYSTIGQYKFYLAFENVNHKDYITEKLWENSFNTGAVPIVLGAPRENYEKFIPPDSFIHVDDFSSPQDLAAFLLELDKDDHRYRQYFNWRSSYEVVRNVGWDSHYCKACKVLHRSQGYQVIPDLAKWFI
ncbi:fucosyltransferase 5 (alpha (1,3) fucosyltransferase) [Xenopus tropicalis]|uniref:Fucosyltransferase n=2 Tax=Xenopus tropicalis TaxID=8364 RepID=A0A8J0Q996_XENTR|nr:fucosyltransferase 5 (alpha (1,3) fucosyltransferase) [Xenopus tropicalis]|eukprot:NP_001106419.2 fucosyltransferase 5 (alpha (1,3) fucosyltransferase) [Xenopus tropicalis]